MSHEAPARPSPATTRRGFLGSVGTVAAATVTGSALRRPSVAGSQDAPREAQTLAVPAGPGLRRADEAFRLRVTAAWLQRNQPLPPHPSNGDEARYADQIGSYSKGLPHNGRGEVDLNAYRSLLHALETGHGADFERIVLGVGDNRLTNPQAGLAFAMEGPDAHALVQKPAPAFASAEEAGEIAENYWMALTRDVAFSEYGTHPLTLAAAAHRGR